MAAPSFWGLFWSHPPPHLRRRIYMNVYKVYQGKMAKDSGQKISISDAVCQKGGKWGLLSLRLAHNSYIWKPAQPGECISLGEM